MESPNNSNSLSGEIPASLLQAIQKLIDQKVDEKMKHYEQKYNEALTKLAASSTTSSKKLPTGIKNGSVKPDPEEHTPSTRPSTGIKKIVPKTSVGNSKPRSDSKESTHSKTTEESKRETSKKPIKDDAAEKKKEEARLKKEELERKKKEELEKKKEEIERKKREKEEAKLPAKQVGKSVGKKGGKDDDNDDPIEKSLNERIAAGGITQVVKSAESGKVSKSLGKAIEKKIKDKQVPEEDKGGETPKSKPPGKLIQAIEKNVS